MPTESPAQHRKPGAKTRAWLLAARPRTLPAAFAPVALGSALAAHAQLFQIMPALLCAAFALLAQIGANFANDYFDFRYGADTPGRLGPTRAVATGLIAPRAMLLATFLALGLSAATGLGLVYYGGWGLVIVGAASLLGALAYTPLSYHGLGEIFALVFFGYVAVLGTYYVETLAWPPAPAAWCAATACGLLAANILLVNNIRDIATDTLAGKRTLAARFGRKFGQGLYAFNVGVVIAVTLAFFSIERSLWFVPALGATIPLGIFFIRTLGRIPEGDGPRYNRLLAQSAQFMAGWALLMAAGMVFA